MELLNHHTIHITLAGAAALFLIVLALFANRRLKHTEQCLVPRAKTGASGIFEVVVELILNLMEGVMGKKAWKMFPVIGACFLYIFVCNIMGLIPGLIPPTENINTNAACAIIIFLYYNYQGIREHGTLNYLKHFLGPVLWLGPLMMVIELISHAVRPISLSVRLFGNMTGDHMVLQMFSSFTYTKLIIPVIFLGLGLFVSFIQAFVFSLLSIVYIGLATESDH